MHTKDLQIRDPFVYVDGDRYLLYASRIYDGKRCIAVYQSRDLEEWMGPKIVFDPSPDFWGTVDFWAPEMHAWQGKYYLFVSFRSETRNRATSILVSDSPEGPFEPFGAEQITPPDWVCLDGTFWAEDGKPYMVFCHEWVQVGDGGMCAVPMKDDLSGPDGAAVTLFTASEPAWSVSISAKDEYVTDGPFLYRASDGKLNMLWSSFSRSGYTVARAVSDTGRVFGPWRHAPTPVLARDGGHCMLFTDLAGVTRISFHCPNVSPRERAYFLPVHMDADGDIRVL